MNFYKYQGTGNDFVMIDNRDLVFPSQDSKYISQLCDRKFGIGADGLILIQSHTQADFEMIYFNADGNLGSMCGNGARCTIAFAQFLGIIQGKTRFMAYDGLHEASIQHDWVSVQLHIQSFISQIFENHYFTDTGSPHYVVWMPIEELEKLDVCEAGRAIRYAEKYREKGTNVNFVADTNGGIFVRTYERGVENETLSCGTGVTAAALVKKYREPSSPDVVKIQTLGGNLEVQLGEKLYLSGPAKQVFSGKI